MTTQLTPAAPTLADAGHDDALLSRAKGFARQSALGHPNAPRWARPALWAVLLLATLLYTWNLSAIGDANTFYAAAVYSGTQSWKAWFFGALDAGGFITVDKPPFALWVMGLSARVFGYGTWQMMLPVASAGIASVGLLYTMVRRSFGYAAATIAALVLALSPITVAINRDNNPDPFLVLLMLLGAAGCLRAVRTGKLMPLVWCGVAVGFAFNTKMLQGYMVLPAFVLAYGFAAKGSVLLRLRNLGVAGVALVVSSGWWMVVTDLWPKDSRPYIGGSTDNTVWDLVIGYNGLGRIFGAGSGVGSAGNGANFGGEAGAGRLFNDIMGGQISWLIPFATIALVVGLVLRGRRPRTDMQRSALLLWGGWAGIHYLVFSFAEGTFHPYYTTAMAPGVAALCGAGGVAMYRAFRRGPALKWAWVLPTAITGSAVWAVVLLNRATDWNTWLVPVIAVLAVGSVVGLLVLRFGKAVGVRRPSAVAALAGVVALLAGPSAYAVSATAAGSVNGINPTAGPTTGNGMGGFGGGGGGQMPSGGQGGPGGQAGQGQQQGQQPGGQQPGGQQGQADGQMQPPTGGTGAAEGGQGQMPTGGMGGMGGFGGGRGGGMGGGADTEMIAYLKEHQDGAEWLVAVATDQSAASIILAAREPVISMGGWTGSDPAMTLDKLKALVKAGRLHYVVTGGGMGGGMGGNSGTSEVTTWIQEHGTLVDPSDYGSTASTSDTSDTSGTSAGSDSASGTSGLYRLDASDIG